MSFIALAKHRRLIALGSLGEVLTERPIYLIAPQSRTGLPGLGESEMDRLLGVCSQIEAERKTGATAAQEKTGTAERTLVPFRPRRPASAANLDGGYSQAA